MSIEEFITELTKLNIETSSTKLEQLSLYLAMLKEYNQKFNLTSITCDEEIYLKHFYDSLTITKVIDLKKVTNLLDLGTGAGFPGLVLKIFYPNLEVTLLDSNHKKISFLEDVIQSLHLTKISCLCIRAEKLPQTYRERYDVVTSRAVASLKILLELSIPYIKVDGYFIAMKSSYEKELNNSKAMLNNLFCEIEQIENFILPDHQSKRTLLKIKKNRQTPFLYPRKYDKIKKEK